MKIISHTSTELTLKDSAGCFWLLGLFFVIIAGIFTAGLMGLFTNLHEINAWEKLGAWVISLGGLFAGFWFIYSTPGTTVKFDKTEGSVSLNSRGLMRNETETYKLKEVRDIIIAESQDSEGDPVYQIELKLFTEKRVPLSKLWINNKPALEETVKKIKDFLGQIF